MVAILNGRREAIELFLCEGESEDALRRAQECILEGLWHGISFGMDSHTIRSDPTLSRLMHFASRLDVTSMNQIKAAEVSDGLIPFVVTYSNVFSAVHVHCHLTGPCISAA